MYEAAQAGWRLAAHGRAAAAMRAQGASPLERANHVEYSAPQGDSEAIATLIEAAGASEARSPEASARGYAAAPRRCRPRIGSRADLETELAAAQLSTGDLEAARESMLLALELIGDSDPAARLRLTAACAASEHFLGRHEDAQARLHASFEALPTPASRAGVETLMALSTGAFFAMEPEPMCDFAGRALERARALEDEGLLFACLALLTHAESLADRLPEAQRNAELAEGLVRSLGDDALAERLDSVNRLAWATLGLQRFSDAVATLGATARSAERGRTRFPALPTAGRGDDDHAPWTRCGGDGSATEAPRDSPHRRQGDYVTCSVLTACTHVALAAGDVERARQYADESVELVEVLPGRRIPAMAAVRLAVLRREMGESCTTAELDELAGGWDLPLIPLWRPATSRR